MNPATAIRPRRSHVLPFLVFSIPALYFVYREASMECPVGASPSCLDAAHAGYALAGLLGAYLLAAGLLAVVNASALADAHPYVRLALRPDDATLAVLAFFLAVATAYLLATLVTAIPGWLDALLEPFGFVLALPFAATYAVMVVATAASSGPSLQFQAGIVAVSLSVTGVWLFALATGTARLLTSTGSGGLNST